MIRPKTYFTMIQWLILLLLLICSIFFSRQVALIAFSLFMAWKLYSIIILPQKLHQVLAGQRLKNQKFRDRFQHSLFAVNKIKTRLFELGPRWPTVVLYDKGLPTLFISRNLMEKLSNDELTLLIQWSFYLFEENLPAIGLKVYSLFLPFFRIARWLDRWVLLSGWQKVLSLESLLLHGASLLFYPLYLGHQSVLVKLAEEFGYEKVENLRKKIFYIVHCHEQRPPLEFAFMLIEPEIVDYNFRKTLFGDFTTPEFILKGSHYGNQQST